jgi:hypothetical protein
MIEVATLDLPLQEIVFLWTLQQVMCSRLKNSTDGMHVCIFKLKASNWKKDLNILVLIKALFLHLHVNIFVLVLCMGYC